jgi:hypothetical protein
MKQQAKRIDVHLNVGRTVFAVCLPAPKMLGELPRHCVKKSSKGHQQYWRGYKLHLDVADGQIPITALLTGACLYDLASFPLLPENNLR